MRYGYFNDSIKKYIITNPKTPVKMIETMLMMQKEMELQCMSLIRSLTDSEGDALEHLKRAVDFIISNTSEHGLPLLGFADWNDTVNLPSGAESIFNAELLGCVLKEMIELKRRYLQRHKGNICR